MGRKYVHAKVNNVSLFTTNSKTACPSWAISQRSCTGAAGCAICSKCYGKKGRFGMSNVKNALSQRYNWFENSKESEVVDTIVAEINHFGEEFFRSHVVGDFKNVRSIRIWKKIITKLPNVRFWFPTKAYRVKAMVKHLVDLNKLENVAVRPSAEDFDVDAPEVKGLSAGATAHKNDEPHEGHFNCPGNCKDCRVCWDEDTKVTYHYH